MLVFVKNTEKKHGDNCHNIHDTISILTLYWCIRRHITQCWILSIQRMNVWFHLQA